jgi:hypothetical protein
MPSDGLLDGASAAGADDPQRVGDGGAAADPKAGGVPSAAAGDAKPADAAPAKSPGAWIEDIDDADLRKRLSKFAGKSVSDLANAYAHAESLIGSPPETLVRIDDAVKQDPTGVLKRLGLPETPDGYTFDLKDVTPGALDDKGVAWFRKVAHENGLLPRQADAVLKASLGLAAEQQKAAAEAAEKTAAEAVDALRRKHGGEFDGLVKSAKLAANELGIREALTEAGLGTHPAVIEALAKVGKLLSEGSGPGVGPGSGAPAGPNESAAMARELKRQQLAAVRAGDNAKADSLQSEIDRLYARAFR